ncbi:luciferin 4-monooxygenase [Culex quinquefasciatus]|uniref:Luciferin 4-monooxygenase n=1 Tax=Culex quinquefasciatus TaxID=7176 RepID=B0XFZ2_CULQU|nr:luciferin 4-monooxygenase [Culex quinquefasciatus]|eukprot:XP_001868564.1 luciferin 4-monooxygenase [Culex quinquefasciatus]
MFHTYDSQAKLWLSRHPPAPFKAEAGLGQLILDVLGKISPSKVIQLDTDTGVLLTAEELRLRIVRVAQNLSALGFRRGDMAAMACSNSENLAPLALGLMVAGVPFIALPTVGFNGDDLGHLMGLVQPKLVICDDSVYKQVLDGAGKALKMKPVIFAVESERENVRKVEELLQGTGTEGDFTPQAHGDMQNSIGMILCTSGTTGRPKGVCVSQASIAIVLSRPVKPAPESDLNLTYSPLYWGTGLFALLNSVSTGITRAISRNPFSEDHFFDALAKYHPTHFFTPPSHAVLLLNHPRAAAADFSSLRSWSLSGSIVSAKLRQSLEARLPNGRTVNNYASSELGLIAMDMIKQKPDAVGQLMPHLDAKVVDELGVAVGCGEQGELLIRTGSIPFMGYYNDEQATRELIDADGWIRTGDIGYLDEEGFVYLVDRKKDVVKYRGYQMSPVDLEKVIEGIAGVKQVCVVGVPEMDGTSDLPAAVVVKREGSNLTEEQLISEYEGQVSDHKRLRGGVFFWDELPLTATGKVVRRKVRDMLIEAVNK